MKRIITEIKGVLDWYFQLKPHQKIQVNYLTLITSLILLAYANDRQHRENHILLSNRIDIVNNNRSLEQGHYTKKLEYYTDKFNNLLEVLLEERRKEIEEDKKTTRNKEK